MKFEGRALCSAWELTKRFTEMTHKMDLRDQVPHEEVR